MKQIELLITKLFGFKIQSRLLVLHCALSGPMKMNSAHSPNKPDFPPKTGMSYNAGSFWVETLSEGVNFIYMQDIIPKRINYFRLLLDLQLFMTLLLILVYGGISDLFRESSVCILMGPVCDNAVLKDDFIL